MSSLIPAIAQFVGLKVFSGVISINPHRAIQRKAPNGTITKIVADAVLEERGHDELITTDHPVEQGTTTSDHAYKLPLELYVTYAWSGASSQNVGNNQSEENRTLSGDILQQIKIIPQFNDGSNFLRSVYQDLIKLQEEVVLLDVYTGKRIYHNMLIKALSVTTDRMSEHVLVVNVTLKEIIVTTTRLVTVSPSQREQLFPNRTQTIQNNGTQQLQPPTNVSIEGVGTSIIDDGDSS